MMSAIAALTAKPTVSLMTEPLLGDFADDGWPGYACRFADWTACVNSTAVRCDDPRSACRRCTSKRSGRNESITCTRTATHTSFVFPPGGIFPVTEQFTIPPNTTCGQCVHPGECCGPCSDAGFDNLTVTYLDGSVPAGSCMKEGAGC